MFADRLATEQRMLGDGLAAETQLADLDAQVKQVCVRVCVCVWVGALVSVRAHTRARTLGDYAVTSLQLRCA